MDNIIKDLTLSISDENISNIMPSKHNIQDYLDDEGYLDDNGNFIDYVDRAVQIGWELGYKYAVKQIIEKIINNK